MMLVEASFAAPAKNWIPAFAEIVYRKSKAMTFS